MRLFYIFFILLLFSCTVETKKQDSALSSVLILQDSITVIPDKVNNLLCDSLDTSYDWWVAREYKDTIIGGTKYPYAMPLIEGHILVSPEVDKEYGMWKNIEILNDGKVHLVSGDPSYDYFYEVILPSPNKNYIFYLYYTETGRGDVNDEGEIINLYLKYRAACIYDIKKSETVSAFYGSEGVNGAWNNCNQWVEDDEVLFYPEQD